MPFHNPFIKDGRITFPEGASLVKHVERWAKVRGDKLAYRFLDFSTERDGIARELRWNEFGARNRAIGARLQQVTEPGDRVAVVGTLTLVAELRPELLQRRPDVQQAEAAMRISGKGFCNGFGTRCTFVKEWKRPS